jgi:hypothetical protein
VTSNRRILKTVCPVVWEGARAQSRAPDPIETAATLGGESRLLRPADR